MQNIAEKGRFVKGMIPWNKGTIDCCPDAVRAKISQKLKGRKLSEETKKKMSLAGKGKKKKPHKRSSLSEITKQKISLKLKGRIISEKTKAQISDTLLGRRCSPRTEFKKGLVPWNKDKPFMQKEAHPNWKGGISFDPYCPKFNSALKERIRERDNRTCQLCGIKENGKKLTAHHVHYDKPNCDPDLISLCCSCNTKVNYNRNYWEDYFMKLLEERGLLCNQNVKNSQNNLETMQ